MPSKYLAGRITVTLSEKETNIPKGTSQMPLQI
jgi:hypothetical protein